GRERGGHGQAGVHRFAPAPVGGAAGPPVAAVLTAPVAGPAAAVVSAASAALAGPPRARGARLRTSPPTPTAIPPVPPPPPAPRRRAAASPLAAPSVSPEAARPGRPVVQVDTASSRAMAGPDAWRAVASSRAWPAVRFPAITMNSPLASAGSCASPELSDALR